ncbi:hypothetical protein [Tropicimonas marinistellae]|uniref:hypothetical protein n=1 Tax=Tropicimonas marinistellae TaxID=1739787 RepID=UPI000831F385|nr:hypothetical protein [Tropicimonas marinistellae]
MTLRQSGSLAAFGAAGTYGVGVALLILVLIPAGYGFDPTAAEEAVGFLMRNSEMMIAWNTIVYVLNAILLGVLVVALHELISSEAPQLMRVSSLFGMVWVGLLLAAGMVANSGLAAVAFIVREDVHAATVLWQVLRAVEDGLGGGNEIAGALWLAGSMIAARSLPVAVRMLGIAAGAAGLATLVPALSRPMGAVFRFATLAWFVAIGVALSRGTRGETGARAT